MKIKLEQLRGFINKEVRLVLEQDPKVKKPSKPGSEEIGDVEGALDVKKIATTLEVDPTKLSTAIANAKKGERKTTDDKVFADAFINMVKADPEETTKVANALKKVTAKEGISEKADLLSERWQRLAGIK